MGTEHLYVPKAQYEAKVRELEAQLAEADFNFGGWRSIKQRLEAENERLRKVVLAYKHRHDSGGPVSDVRPDSCRCCACDDARAALV